MPRPPKRCESSKWLVTRLMDAGYSRTEARDALLNVTHAIMQSITDGHATSLYHLGTFIFRPYSGNKKHGTPPGFRLKFKPSADFAKRLRTVVPLEPRKLVGGPKAVDQKSIARMKRARELNKTPITQNEPEPIR